MIKKSFQFLKRTLTRPQGLRLDSVFPVSTVFGEDRGTPIDRFYIERFLDEKRSLIKGDVLEVAENKYTKRFGSSLHKADILHPIAGTPNATVIGDLTMHDSLPENAYDCFVCTQTFPFIYRYAEAIKGAHKVLRPGGVLLATLSGIAQVSTFDMDRWGDYWRFTSLSAKLSFEEIFGAGNVAVETYGNCFAAISLLRGVAVEEVSQNDLLAQDKNYPVIISVIARK